MNNNERRLLEILQEGKERFGFNAVKAEFEAEGTRSDEFLRLLEIARRAGVKVGLKIGGCEAVRDLIESKQYGVDYIIAPMVETPYALSKYVAARNMVYPRAEGHDTVFLFNLETITSFNNIDAMVAQSAADDGVDGVVFGRVDFAGSLGQDRRAIHTSAITDYVVRAAAKAKAAGQQFVVGGAVSHEGIDALKAIRQVHLDRFETRKIIFDAAILDGDQIDDALTLAIDFELTWLRNKHEYYKSICEEDLPRLGMLERRATPAISRVA